VALLDRRLGTLPEGHDGEHLALMTVAKDLPVNV
jgi:hypothetical protein